jgi:hypothetical protein
MDDQTLQTLGALLDAVADLLAAKVAERLSVPATRYADGKANPLGSRRAFLDAARRGDFPSFKRGREVVARWEDVVAYIESRPRDAPAARVDEAEDDRAALTAAGVRLRGRAPGGDPPPKSHSRRRR